ncbi:chondroitinase-B domain-containing protein [Paraglaciecola aquimarina]|uniref:Chondroitinase-B domain-containing protein n=2 Tax=Paraglaciecola aquimarina TaxID=1235557 RepID=A0ABU3SV75_9ALTE|nr:chondroitinase-B domain-containing protein [Paraglaciecola aquimarina]MDU0353900.1 chondroitinase-B domain-containing protein [Paraglaciecola aquimarina]
MLLMVGCSSSTPNVQSVTNEYLVSTPEEYRIALNNIKPGGSIVLKNGTWRDFEIVFKGKGSESSPITLRAQTPGKVILSGQSNLSLGGEYLVVSGLVFKNGYTPTGEVISFRLNEDELAYHSRVTEVVIDNYSNPEKFEQDKWVVMYGQHNRFDHSNLVGKRNAGVTMTVRLNTESSQQNFHRIDHNYFGPRPTLGSNGGETLRIGTSHYSLTDSLTTIENNYFDRCDGEVEIISNKSGKNKILNNVFYESRGTLTLRHGNGNLVEGNVFFGNGVDHTGGIRIINSDQIVRNNYMEGLTGYRFGSGFTVMNGVPNSSINRYHQVNNALIENNSLFNVDHFHLAAGSDAERTAAPINSRMINNLMVNENGSDGISIFDDISGINFVGNVLPTGTKPTIENGFSVQDVELKRAENGLLYPTSTSLADKGVSRDIQPISKDQVGAPWYPKTESEVDFDSGKTINVANQKGALLDGIQQAQSGDVLLLADGDYQVSKVIKLTKTLTIKASHPGKVTLYPQRSTFVDIADFGNLKLVDLIIDGKQAPDSAGNTLIRTSRIPMQRNYRLELLGNEVTNLDVNHSFHVFDAGFRSFADNIVFNANTFSNITGDILRLNKETDDLGIYNAEYIYVKGNVFNNVEGAIAKVYRGGTDESTFGPHLLMSKNILKNVGKGKRNTSQAAVKLHGVQVATIEQNQFNQSAPVDVEHTVGQPITKIIDNDFSQTAAPKIVELRVAGQHTAILKNNKVH